MREWEVKAVVDDLLLRREVLVRAGAELTYAGEMIDDRYDTPAGDLAARDQVLRIRTYRNQSYSSSTLDWKGPSSVESGVKVRDEITTSVGDAATLATTLKNLGYEVVFRIEREIVQYDLNGTMIRFETYPTMDTLIEVEGDPEGIEEAVTALEMPRESFRTDALPVFVKEFETRTGLTAVLS